MPDPLSIFHAAQVIKIKEAKSYVVCNFDTQPGYSGIDNTLYDNPKTKLLTGDAANTARRVDRGH